MSSAIDSTSSTSAAFLAASANTSSTAIKSRTTSLSQEDFLKILVNKMTRQDPMNPASDEELLGQVVQMSSLEQSKKLSEEMTQLRQAQQLTQASGLIGRTVEISTGSSDRLTGTVQAVQVRDGNPQILVNGAAYDLEMVTEITNSRPITPN